MPMSSGTHSMPVLLVYVNDQTIKFQNTSIFTRVVFINWMLLNTDMNVNIQLVMNTFGTLFPDKIFSLTFP